MGKDYFEVRVDFELCNEDITDLAASFLADAGLETFEPDAVGLTAYIAADATADANRYRTSRYPRNLR